MRSAGNKYLGFIAFESPPDADKTDKTGDDTGDIGCNPHLMPINRDEQGTIQGIKAEFPT